MWLNTELSFDEYQAAAHFIQRTISHTSVKSNFNILKIEIKIHILKIKLYTLISPTFSYIENLFFILLI